MKKNLLSIIILALLIVNIVLTAIMMFSVAGAARSTSALVTDIASVLKLELGTAEEAEKPKVPLENNVNYDLPEALNIPLRAGEDGADHMAIVKLTLSMDSKNKGYKTAKGEDMTPHLGRIQSEITMVISQYDFETAKDPAQWLVMEDEILSRLQVLFDSDFIYSVSIREIIFA